MDALASKKRILILGGGFGGVYTARHLEKLCKRRADIEVVLVSRDNFLLMTPLLFEVCSGTLDVRHCSFPIRAFLRTTRIGEALVQGVDLERRVVHLAAEGENHELAYDQLVLALGSRTNKAHITFDHIEQLRQLIELPFSQKPADPRDSGILAGRNLQAELGCIDHHRAEFVDPERVKTAPDSLLLE